jgi:ribose 1,5-bisphosphate isomerase
VECDFHEQNYKKARDRIADVMAARIIDRCTEYDKNQIVIGTHCHSGAVIKTLIKSKDFISQVIVSKTEPEQQGVLTAHDLCEKGVPVKFINMEQYGTEFRKASMFLFGVDAVSAEGTVLNKAGTRMIATLARTKELPVYFLGETYKYARNTIYGGLVRVERRDVKENLLFNHLKIDLEKYAKAGLLETSFQAFDTTKHELYDSIVSEQGFLPMREAFEREWAAYL